MNAVEFVTDLTGSGSLAVPADAAARLPRSGKARVIVLTEVQAEDENWRRAAYDQFLRDEPPEDAVYEALC
jgi:hypothetical protein